MGILDVFGKKDNAQGGTKGPPFTVATELFPYKLQAKKNSSASLIIKIKNVSKDAVLTSVVAEVPPQLGFDEMNLSKQKELKVGEIQPNELKEVKMNLYSSLKSDPGEYTVTLTTYAHYRDYTHVLDSVKKRISIDLI